MTDELELIKFLSKNDCESSMWYCVAVVFYKMGAIAVN